MSRLVNIYFKTWATDVMPRLNYGHSLYIYMMSIAWSFLILINNIHFICSSIIEDRYLRLTFLCEEQRFDSFSQMIVHVSA